MSDASVRIEISCADFHTAAPPVLVDVEENVASKMEKITSLQLPRITLPKMSSEMLWNKEAIKVTWVPENALFLKNAYRANMRTCIGWRGNGQRTLWLDQYVSTPTPSYYIQYFQKDSHLIYLQIFGGERQAKLAGAARSSCHGTSAVTAATQRCRLFHSDSLQMPPGQEAKINTSSNVAQWLACNKKNYISATLWGSLNRPFNSTNRQTETASLFLH